MKFALEVWSADFDQIEGTCHAAEELGYAAFYYGESPTALNLDCWTVLAALARSTRTVRLGPVISNILPDYRSPALLAKQAATVAVLSGGRLDFRTGAGAAPRYARPWWSPFGIGYPSYAERLALLDCTLSTLRALWAGESLRLAASAADDAACLGFVPPPIPVTVAATGPAGMMLAARQADVWEASYRTAGEFSRLVQTLQTNPVTARPRLERSLEIDVLIGSNQTRVDVLVADIHHQRDPAVIAAVLRRALIGTPDAVARQLHTLAESGVDQLLLAFHDPHDLDALESFARARAIFFGAS